MKKLIIAMFTVAMLLSFASCAEGGNVDDQSSGKGDAMSTVESVVSSITGDVTSGMSDSDSNNTSSANS